jgi:biotin carboxyl carrier protein
MRRWTVLLISHDSEAPRTYSVTERGLRVGALLGAAFVLVATIGVGTVIASVGSITPQPAARVTESTRSLPSPELRSLRGRVARLQGSLDTIRQQESKLRVAAGVPKTDSKTIVSRFLSLIPAFLKPRPVVHDSAALAKGGSTTSVTSAGAVSATDWSNPEAARAELGRSEASADSLAAHAEALASGFRELADGTRLQTDTMGVFSLRPESLTAVLQRGEGTRRGDTLVWSPKRTSAIASGSDAVVTHLLQLQGGRRWEIELRAVGGVVAQISAPGRPLVRSGEKVAPGQFVLVVEPASSQDKPEDLVRIGLRRNGVAMDLGPGAPATGTAKGQASKR